MDFQGADSPALFLEVALSLLAGDPRSAHKVESRASQMPTLI